VTDDERRARKRAYDAVWRASNHDRLLAQKAAYYAANRDRILAAQSRRYAQNRGRVAERQWARRGIKMTVDEYDVILSSQGGMCALCGITPSATRRLAVDHDHTTGRVRGLLCSSCNRTVLPVVEQVGVARISTYLGVP